jgi:hypothetical protein
MDLSSSKMLANQRHVRPNIGGAKFESHLVEPNTFGAMFFNYLVQCLTDLVKGFGYLFSKRVSKISTPLFVFWASHTLGETTRNVL